MDNITHTLVGVTLAEAAVRFRETRSIRPAAGWSRYAWFASIAANNFPDLDFLYAGKLSGKLGYLLHHRGHTHTLLGGLLMGLVLFGCLECVAKWRKRVLTKTDRYWLLALSVLGTWFHIGLDFWNSYGVHPFWPFDNRWYFGDSIFIVEPLLWVTLAAFLARSSSFRPVRACLGAVPVAAVLLAWFTPFVPWPMATILTLVAGLSALVGWKAGAKVRTVLALAALLTLPFLFSRVSRHVRTELAIGFPESKDIILSPYPANPLCWNVHVIQVDSQTYSMVHGLFSPYRAWPVTSCPRRGAETTQPLNPWQAPDSRYAWLAEWSVPVGELKTLAARHCVFSAFLKFARAPFAFPLGNQLIFGDARFDREKELGFAEFITSKKPTACPEHLPPWVEPRAELLR